MIKYSKIERAMSEAIALKVDAEIWWLGLEKHYQVYIKEMFQQMIDEMRPKWIPRFVWRRYVRQKS